MNMQLPAVELPEEYPDGTWIHLPDLHGSGYTDVIYRDDAEGHYDGPERPDRHWWSFRRRTWIDWPTAVRAGAIMQPVDGHPGAVILEPAAPGAGQRIAQAIRAAAPYHTPCDKPFCGDCRETAAVERSADIAWSYPWGEAPCVAECTQDTTYLLGTAELVPEQPEQDDVAWDAIKVYCPGSTCHAAPGEACRTSEGNTRRELHLLRRLATLDGPLHRCPHGPCPGCWHTGWIPEDARHAASPA